MRWKLEDLDALTAEELADLERRAQKMLSIWEIQNLRGTAAVFHDDQHIGEKRRELFALDDPAVDAASVLAARKNPLVDSLEGNMLIHPLTTPVIEVDPTDSCARGVWWSLGIEGFSNHRETPMAIVSVGMVPGAHVREHGTWKILWGVWQRTTKNEYHAGWVHSMVPTNTRPPLTPEQDRQGFGKYAYQQETVRQPVPQPPAADTWTRYPQAWDQSWLTECVKENSYEKT